MPIKRCKLSNGGSGYKWGNKGKCYSSREKALRQMRAIKYSESLHAEIDESDELTMLEKQEFHDTLDELDIEENATQAVLERLRECFEEQHKNANHT